MSGQALAQLDLTPAQVRAVSYPREGAGPLWLGGLPGSGKSTALMARLAALLREGRRPYEILVLVPQRAQAERYEAALSRLEAPTRGGVDVVTFYGLARRSVDLFWPLVAREAGFERPDQEPTFLTLETAQYFMWRIVEPLMAHQGYFSDLVVRRERLLSQLIDNLNKSALVGFGHTEILRRLRGAWTGSPEHVNRYWQAQDCAIRFRDYCLAHGLIDFSLTVELYARYLLQHEVYRRYFRARYRHLLVDNVEENVPVAHDMIAWAMGHCDSTVLAFDEGGGYRLFLGADPEGGRKLADACVERVSCTPIDPGAAHPLAFADSLRRALHLRDEPAAPGGLAGRAVIEYGWRRYWIQMIRWMADSIAQRVAAGTPPSEMAIIAPYVSEVTRFAIGEELAQRQIPLRLLRPARPLRDDPVVRGLLTLALLAHPQWQLSMRGEPYHLPIEDVALALDIALEGLDPIRARELAQAALPLGEERLVDLSGGSPGATRQADLGRLWEAVGFAARQPYETLRVWLEAHGDGDEPLGLFLVRLFGDLLSRPGFGFHHNPDKARAYGRVVESAVKFAAAVSLDEALGQQDLAREYVQLILGGIASAEYEVDRPQREP
ncbi:MAG: AAA family ATPase, partial [Anaerolineae bacterium]|nr:AAA family ATPase [Anaerolineae bacterium]